VNKNKTLMFIAVISLVIVLVVPVGVASACRTWEPKKQQISFTVVNGGSGYTTPHVQITGGGGHGMTAVARVSQGVVIKVTLIDEGHGYTSAPTITLRDPSPRAHGAIVKSNFPIMKVCTPTTPTPTPTISFTVVNGGTGYTTPAVIISGGGGSGMTATARVSQGVVYAVVLTNPGIGYTSAPTVTLSDPSPRAHGAVIKANFK
jgi:hypothetical protein